MLMQALMQVLPSVIINISTKLMIKCYRFFYYQGRIRITATQPANLQSPLYISPCHHHVQFCSINHNLAAHLLHHLPYVHPQGHPQVPQALSYHPTLAVSELA